MVAEYYRGCGWERMMLCDVLLVWWILLNSACHAFLGNVNIAKVGPECDFPSSTGAELQVNSTTPHPVRTARWSPAELFYKKKESPLLLAPHRRRSHRRQQNSSRSADFTPRTPEKSAEYRASRLTQEHIDPNPSARKKKGQRTPAGHQHSAPKSM